MKDAIAEFREWAFTMYPLLPTRDYEYNNRMREEVRSELGSYGWNIIDSFESNSETTRKVITNSEHTLRLHLMYAIMGETAYHTRHMFESDAEHTKCVKAQFNRKINKVCGFTKKVRG